MFYIDPATVPRAVVLAYRMLYRLNHDPIQPYEGQYDRAKICNKANVKTVHDIFINHLFVFNF